jgi:hypothetical protein
MTDSTTSGRRVCRTAACYDDPSSSTTTATVHNLAPGALPYQASAPPRWGYPWLACVVDFHHRRCSTTPRRRAHLTRIPDDPQSSSSPMTGCFAAGCRRVSWQGAFYGFVQQRMVFYDPSQYTSAPMFTMWNNVTRLCLGTYPPISSCQEEQTMGLSWSGEARK